MRVCRVPEDSAFLARGQPGGQGMSPDELVIDQAVLGRDVGELMPHVREARLVQVVVDILLATLFGPGLGDIGLVKVSQDPGAVSIVPYQSLLPSFTMQVGETKEILTFRSSTCR